jgi:hypothetical protein
MGRLYRLFRFPMQLVRPAKLAIFLHLQPVLHGSLILGRRVIPLFAVCAGQRNNISHG